MYRWTAQVEFLSNLSIQYEIILLAMLCDIRNRLLRSPITWLFFNFISVIRTWSYKNIVNELLAYPSSVDTRVFLGLYQCRAKHPHHFEAWGSQSHHTESSHPAHLLRWPYNYNDTVVQGPPTVYDWALLLVRGAYRDWDSGLASDKLSYFHRAVQQTQSMAKAIHILYIWITM